MVDSIGMPSQRLLKMLDPWGHVGPRRVLASAAPKGVLWATDPRISAWMATELQSAGAEALLARSFRHVETSLRANMQPACALAVIDFSVISDVHRDALIATRWAGYAGAMIAVAAPGSISARIVTILSLEAIVSPLDPALGPLVASVLARLRPPQG